MGVHSVLAYDPIVGRNEEIGFLVAVNGAGLNLGMESGGRSGTDLPARTEPDGRGLWEVPVGETFVLAEA